MGREQKPLSVNIQSTEQMHRHTMIFFISTKKATHLLRKNHKTVTQVVDTNRITVEGDQYPHVTIVIR